MEFQRKRRRTIILGSRLPVELTFPEPNLKTCPTVGEAFKDIKLKNGKTLNHDIDQAEIKNDLDRKRITKHIPEGKWGFATLKMRKCFPPRLRLGIDWEEFPEEDSAKQNISVWTGKPSPTIMTHRHGYFHPTEDRYLTVREAVKIQSFPNNFEFFGTVTAQWRQIGNAVPPLMAKAIGDHINKLRKTFIRNKLKVKKKVQSRHYVKERSGAFSYHKDLN